MALLISISATAPARRRLRVLRLVPIAMVVAAFGPGLAAGDSTPGEYEVKAAFLLNFARLVEWPESMFPDRGAPLVLAVLGDDHVTTAIERAVAGKTVGTHPLRVVRVGASEGVREAHIVFVSSDDRDRQRDVIEAARGRSLLTVGESNHFARDGGIINFFAQDNKIRFEINRPAADRAGLRISSRLLGLARLVP